MTTIAVKAGVMAADSRMTFGDRASRCDKLYRRAGAIIGVAGDASPALLFVDWYGTGRPRPELFVTGEAEFYALVLDDRGRIFLFDKWCKGERIRESSYAIGSGADLAVGAMDAGKSAIAAVKIACKRDVNSGLPVVFMRRQ